MIYAYGMNNFMNQFCLPNKTQVRACCANLRKSTDLTLFRYITNTHLPLHWALFPSVALQWNLHREELFCGSSLSLTAWIDKPFILISLLIAKWKWFPALFIYCCNGQFSWLELWRLHTGTRRHIVEYLLVQQVMRQAMSLLAFDFVTVAASLGIPLLGYGPFFTKNPAKKFLDLKAKYGKIFRLYMGPNLAIVLNDFEVIKSAFVDQHEIFQGRPENFVFAHITKVDGEKMRGNFYSLISIKIIADSFNNFLMNAGIGVQEGEEWKTTRRFMLQALRDLGMGK